MMHSYEKIPRKMARTEEKEVIHLLPIKDKTGIIPQSIERGTILVIPLFNDANIKIVKLNKTEIHRPSSVESIKN